MKIITDLDIELLDIYEYRYRPGIDGVNGVACIVCLSKTSTFFFICCSPIADAFERIPLILEVDVVSVMHA